MIIYKTTNLINGKFYIGKDKYNNLNYLGSGKILKQAIEKYGENNFSKEILEECSNETELNEKEIFWIDKLNACENGYNIAVGGEGGDTISNHPDRDEICKNHSNWMQENNPMEGKKRSKEHIENWKNSVSGEFKGENNPNYGKTHSKKTKKIMSEKRKNWWNNLSDNKKEQISDKISKANTGKESYWKGKTNSKHSKWMQENNPMEGKTHTKDARDKIAKANSKPKSEEHKKKISESLKGNIPSNAIPVNIENIKYNSLSAASREIGLDIRTIKRRINSDKDKFKDYRYEE